MSAIYCQVCGLANRAGSNYCNRCGAKLEEQSVLPDWLLEVSKHSEDAVPDWLQKATTETDLALSEEEAQDELSFEFFEEEDAPPEEELLTIDDIISEDYNSEKKDDAPTHQAD